MSIRRYRSFSAEMMKMAGDLKDSDVRRLLAEREGEEYLEGGKLPTEVHESEKRAGRFSDIASGAHDYATKNKVDNQYQSARDNAAAIGKGAFTGGAIMGLKEKVTSRPATAKGYRRAIGLGAGIMIADRSYRHHKLKSEGKKIIKTALVQPNVGRAFRSAESALSAGQRTGGFRTSASIGRAPKPPMIGRKFT